MKPAGKSAAALGVAAIAGLAGWTFYGSDPGPNPKDEAVVEQPSGKVLTPADDGSATDVSVTEVIAAVQGNDQDAQTTESEDPQAADDVRDPDAANEQAQNQPAETQETDDQATASSSDKGSAADASTETTTEAEPTQDAAAADTPEDQKQADADEQATDQEIQVAAVPSDAGNQQPSSAQDQDAEQQTNEPANQPDSGSDDPAKVADPIDPLAPTFDIVRVDADGQTVVAGKAPPGSTVEIVLDGQVVGTETADANGGFVAILDVALSGEAQSLQLRVADDTAPETATEAEIATLGDAEPTHQSGATELSQPNLVNGKVPDVGSALAADVQASDAGPTLVETDTLESTGPDLPQPAQGPSVPSLDVATIEPNSTQGEAISVNANSGAATTRPSVPTAANAGDQALAAAPSAPGVVSGGRYRTSAPVFILPSGEPDAAPTLVQPQQTDLALLQPAAGDVRGVVLDRITYSDIGDVRLAGRGRANRAIRIYGNGLIIGTTRVTQDGTWALALSSERGKQIKLFRFDEVDQVGAVSSRIETPFEYSRLSPKVLRERRVVVQRGDVLWRIAEQFYGEGLRYSLIYGANTTLIRDPDLIYPGQVFNIPELVDAN